MSASASVEHASWDPTHIASESGSQAVLETEGIPEEDTMFTSGTNGGKATAINVAEVKKKNKKKRQNIKNLTK